MTYMLHGIFQVPQCAGQGEPPELGQETAGSDVWPEDQIAPHIKIHPILFDVRQGGQLPTRGPHQIFSKSLQLFLAFTELSLAVWMIPFININTFVLVDLSRKGRGPRRRGSPP